MQMQPSWSPRRVDWPLDPSRSVADSKVPLSAAAETVLTFLENVGRRSEAEFYLHLFRQLPKESFAIVLIGEAALSSAPGSVVEQLRFLADLDLGVAIILGAWSQRDSERKADTLAVRLQRRALTPAQFNLDQCDLAQALTGALRRKEIPLVKVNVSDPFVRVGRLARELGTRKVVVLRQKGGLGPHGVSRIWLGPGHVVGGHAGGISVVNLRADHDALTRSGLLPAADARLLSSIKSVLESANLPNTTLSVTSPLALLNELFTVRGAGTLVKLGSTIQRLANYDDLDRERLTVLLESSFKRGLAPGFFDAPPSAIYLEEAYRGAAILQPGYRGEYLTKFAVDPLAQGEGIGQDLWRAMYRDVQSLYWRARPENPISSWYQSVCDGFLHHTDWCIFWRGYEPDDVPHLVRDATERSVDFSG